MKGISWIGNSLDVLRAFPNEAKYIIGTELLTLQHGYEPSNTKAVSDIGAGVKEIRVKTKDNYYRIIYIAKFSNTIYVLHCFIKKSNRMSKKDLVIAKTRYRELLNQFKERYRIVKM